jgi:TRAP-type C4-dicarboxylate transport system permease small subunit
VAGALVVFVEFAVCYDVVMRYFLNSPTVWAFEATENILVWVTFLGAAWLLKGEGHVKIDFVVTRLEPRTQSILNGITYILCAIACLAVVWYGVQVLWSQYQQDLHTHTRLGLLMWPLYVIIPISLFLLFIQFLRNSYKYLAEWRLLQATNRGITAKPEN